MGQIKFHNIVVLSIILFSALGFYFDWPDQKKQAVLKYEVSVTLKLVQVYVTDKKMIPVTDLKKEDFIIYDNGKVQTITEFEKHIVQITPREKKGPELAATQIPSARSVLPRRFFLFFDKAFNNARGLEKAKNAALHFVETQLQPGDEVGIISYSVTRGLKLHEYPTADHEKIKKALKNFGWQDIGGRADDFEAEYWRLMADENPKDASSSGYVFDPWGEKKMEQQKLKAERRSTLFQAYDFIRAMSNLAKALRYIPGFKSIIFFSSGIPYSILIDRNLLRFNERSTQMTQERQWEGLDFHLSFRFEEMLKELKAANCALFAFETSELTSTLNSPLESRGTFTLQQIAEETGGKYFGNINNYEKHIEQMQQLTGCYYVLGYYVDEKWDGKYHEIKVEVKRPGVKVYAQRGYFNPKPFKEWTDLERMLHLVDLALSERPLFQTPLPLRCGGFSYGERNKGNIVLWADLVKGELGGWGGGEVELVFLIFDGGGNIVKMGRWARALAGLPEAAIYFSSPLSVPAGDYRCRVVLRSLETGRGAVGSVEMKIGEVKEAGISLGQPLLLTRSEGQRYENFPSFLFPFDLRGFVPLTEVKRGEKELYALVICGNSGIKEPELRLYGELLFLEGEKKRSLPLRFSLLQQMRTEGREIYFIKIETEPLEPGVYYLYFKGEEVKSGTRSLSQAVFQVIN